MSCLPNAVVHIDKAEACSQMSCLPVVAVHVVLAVLDSHRQLKFCPPVPVAHVWLVVLSYTSRCCICLSFTCLFLLRLANRLADSFSGQPLLSLLLWHQALLVSFNIRRLIWALFVALIFDPCQVSFFLLASCLPPCCKLDPLLRLFPLNNWTLLVDILA